MKNTAKNFMFYVAFVASLGGLLFGFDTAVISGAEKSIQVVYDLSDFSHGFTIAIALIGTIIGAFVCSKPVEKHGRLKALKIIAFLYFVSAVGSAAIIDWYSFLFFRFAGGLAVGASSVVGPMYIAEISPSRWRGRFVAFFQFNIVLGIVLAYFSNYWIHGIALPANEDFQVRCIIEERMRWQEWLQLLTSIANHAQCRESNSWKSKPVQYPVQY